MLFLAGGGTDQACGFRSTAICRLCQCRSHDVFVFCAFRCLQLETVQEPGITRVRVEFAVHCFRRRRRESYVRPGFHHFVFSFGSSENRAGFAMDFAALNR